MENNTTPIFDLNSFEYKVNYALEASAGTGKTFNITEIVKKLMVDYKVGLDKILIVTYTEKAAGELKNRIREILTSPINDEDKTTIKESLEGKVNCDIDNASIGTIHSFCKNTIKEFAISANQSTNLELASDLTLYDFAKKYIREGDILEKITDLLSINYVIDEEDLVKKLVAVCKLYYLNKEYKEEESIISYLPTYPPNKLDDLFFKLLASNNVEETLKNLNAPEYKNYLILKNSKKPKIQEFLKLFDDFKKFCNDGKTQRAYGFTQNAGYLKEEIDSFKVLFKIKTDKFDVEKYLVDKYIVDFYKSYQEFKEANRLQSFNDMIRVVKESVLDNESELLKCLRNKYSYAIIDEFQDTNQLQFDIFSKVFMCENHNIIVVGDPKQSIYSYQGADIKVYQKAINLISNSGKKCRLEKNHRSSVGVVEFGNELFKNYEFDTGFEPSSYRLLKNDKKETRIKFKGEYTPSLRLNEEYLNPEKYAKFAVEQILECTSKDENGKTNLQKIYLEDNKIQYEDVTFNDFVVLAKSRSEMTFIQKALKNAGIPSIRYKDDSLFKDIECAQWLTILEAIDVSDFTGSNRGYFKKALFTKFFDLPLKEISKEIYDSDDIPQIVLFNKWRVLVKDKLWQDLFDTIIIDCEIDKHLSSLKDLQSLAKFKQLANYCIDYLSNNRSLKELINNLRSIIKFGNDDDNNDDKVSLIAKSTDFNCVRIMTMHASKGLQFPVVISVGGFKGPKKSSDAYTFHKTYGCGESKHVVSLNKEDEVNKEQIEEFFRLFYVAYTRPEFLLIAPRYGDEDRVEEVSSKMEQFIEETEGKTFMCDEVPLNYYELKPFTNSSYRKLRDITKEILNSNNNNSDEDLLKKQKEVLKELIKTKNEKVSYKHSYSSLAHLLKEKEEEILDDLIDIDKEGNNDEQAIIYDLSSKQIIVDYNTNLNSVDIPEGYPKGAGMGNAIHEVFERLDFTNYETYLEKIIIDRFEFNGIDIKDNKSWIEYTKSIVNSVLNASLPCVKGNKKLDGSFSLKEIPSKDKKAEIEFNFNYPDEVLKNYLNGFMDLLFRRGDVYSVLDWKSDTLSEDFLSYSDIKELKKHVDQRYSIQRVLYSYCLIKWLKQYYKETEEEVFNNHFGGIYYVFVRGCNASTSNGIYIQTRENWKDLEFEFNRIINRGVK